MAGNYNKVLLMGNLTRDIEVRHTQGNQAVANFGLAVNRRFRVGDEQREEATFVDCEAWGRTAEVMGQYLRKGRPVFVEGRLRLNQWKDQEGNNRSKLLVVVENFQFVDSREDGGGSGGSGGGGRRSSAPAGARSGSQSPSYDDPIPQDDDIPF